MERLILLDFFNAAGGQHWTKNSGWGDDRVEHCDWFGVFCSSSGFVTVLEFFDTSGLGLIESSSDLCAHGNYDNNLVGSLPHSLGGLSRLEKLALSCNSKLVGEIPESFADLQYLKYLILPHNSMTGSIPQFTSQLSELILAYNDFSGPVDKNLRDMCTDGSNVPCMFHGNPKLRCEKDEFSLGDYGNLCTPCPNCKKDGTCDNGYDETLSGLCDLCNLDSFENQGECLECPANPFITNILPVVFFFIVAPALKKLLDELQDRGYITLPSLKLDITNVVRVKQLGALLQVIGIFAALSINLSSWFDSLAMYTEFFAFPLQLSPVCTGWYESLGNSNYYWVRGWCAFALVYALSMLFQNAHRIPALRSRLKRERFIEMQKIAAILILQATLICMPLSINAGITFREVHTWDENRQMDIEYCLNETLGPDPPTPQYYYAPYYDSNDDPYDDSNDDPETITVYDYYYTKLYDDDSYEWGADDDVLYFCEEKFLSEFLPPMAYLQFAAPLFLGLAIHYIIHRASVKCKHLYSQEVQNMKGVASVDDVEETEDDLKKCTAFYASFCQQYVPKEFSHEER